MNKALRKARDEIVHLFVDDGSLATFAVVLMALIGGGVKLLHVPPLWGGAALVVGLAAILLESLQRVAKTGKKR
jgi:hypothetical protein